MENADKLARIEKMKTFGKDAGKNLAMGAAYASGIALIGTVVPWAVTKIKGAVQKAKAKNEAKKEVEKIAPEV